MAHLKSGTLGMTILLGLLTAIGPLSTDMYLPSLPSIQQHFGATTAQAQWTLSAYLLGFALGQVFYGPLSDRRGRKQVMLAGLALYAFANLASAMAPSLEVLIAARFLQGVGAAGPMVLARAIVRDLHEGREAGQMLARMGTIMGIVPAIAPMLGAGIEILSGWRMNFLAVVFLAIALGIAVARRLPETLRQPLVSPFSVREIMRGYGELCRDGRFTSFALLSAVTYAGLFAFISGSSFVMQGHFGLSPAGFAATFGVMVLGYILGTVMAQKVVASKGSLRAIEIGAVLQAVAGLALLGFSFVMPYWLAGLAVPMAFYAMGVGFTLPQSAAGALMPFPDRAGSVSSLLGIMQMSFAAIVGALVGAFVAQSPVALTAATALMGLIGMATLPRIRRVSTFS
ncbi:MAG: multidrug effflux MFS transporter [Methylobacterium sp.]|jgi:DHA1 family bicyclomycin/chloramphenicol resistance-like MFS transporter|nr:multidrug effflux MFS transporter [Methylobacterium sp.]MCA3639050.1 multidrug effflux MFS transporter [Methylobacterium sp.]